MTVAQRQSIERRIVRRLVKDALAMGLQIALDNGEGSAAPAKSENLQAIMAAVMTTDEERLSFYNDGQYLGVVFLVYGNDGWDVICDYSVSIEPLLEGALALAADAIEGK